MAGALTSCSPYVALCADIMFDVGEDSALQIKIVRVCEDWWHGEREGRADIMPQVCARTCVCVFKKEGK